MHVLKSRWLALAAVCLSLALTSGCQIDSSTGATGDLTHVKISPDLHLNAAPEGYIYNLWVLGIEVEIIDDSIFLPQFVGPYLVTRFHWDPYLYAATDANGEFVPLTIGNGIQLNPALPLDSVFGSQTPVAFLTVEPELESADQLAVPSGPSLLAFNLNRLSHQAVLVNPFALLSVFGAPTPSAFYTLLSQSNKKGIPGADWRDNETEGLGIWFANPRLRDSTSVDSVDSWDTYIHTVIPEDTLVNAYTYTVWVHRNYPESSFSNFGLLMPDREPDFEFRDGNRTHGVGRYGPSDPIPRAGGQPPIPGVQLGSDPVSEDGHVVGYRYIARNVQGRTDTCIVRIDDPTLTRCNGDRGSEIDTIAIVIDTSLVDTNLVVDTTYVLDTTIVDTFPILSFDDPEPSILYTAYRVTGGDTSMGPTLTGVLDLSNIEQLNRATGGNAFIFLGWEYEAWLVFTKDSGIRPMSLGRFKSPSGFDSENPYTFTDSRYDRHFHFPGEDFVQNLGSHDPALTAPLDIIHDPRVEKIWITIEPDDDLGYDWAPDDPNTQLIYLSAFLPNDLDTGGVAQFPMVHRDINPGPTGLNEGNFFPVVTVQFLPDPVE